MSNKDHIQIPSKHEYNLIVQIFGDILECYSILNETYRVRAYKNTFAKLKDVDFMNKWNSQDKSLKLSDKMIKKIHTIINEGKLPLAENLKKECLVLKDLTNVMGIGVVFAKKLVSKHEISSISDLKKKVKNQKIKLNDIQLLGLKHFDDLNTRIPRKEMDSWNKKLKRILSGYKIDLLGSYIRGKSDSHDIDLLIQNETKNWDEIINIFECNNIFVDIVQKGQSKIVLLIRLTKRSKVRQIDIIITNQSEYPFQRLYMTGSGTFNTKMRVNAKEQGFLLNQKGLFKNKKKFLI